VHSPHSFEVCFCKTCSNKAVDLNSKIRKKNKKNVIDELRNTRHFGFPDPYISIWGLCRVPKSLSSAFYRALGKHYFVECRPRQSPALGNETVYRVQDSRHSEAIVWGTDIPGSTRRIKDLTRGPKAP
jgi:hypothetical protein